MDQETLLGPAPGSARSSRPKVSLCIPAFQAGPYLQDTVDSVLAQDYPNLEVVIVDNNSSDETQSILRKIADDRVRVIRNAVTVPSVDNHNLAVRSSTGEFVKLISADDTLEPDCVTKQVAVLENRPDVSLVAARAHFIDDRGELLIESRGLRGITGQQSGQSVVRRIVRSGKNPIGAPVSVMFRRTDFDRCGGMRGHVVFTMDLDLWVRLLHFGDFYGIDRTLMSYRVRNGSATALTSARIQLAEQNAFASELAKDPRWAVPRLDRVLGRVNSVDVLAKRAVLFKVSAARAARRRPRPAGDTGSVAPNNGVAPSPSGMPLGLSEGVATLSVVICAYTMRRWSDLCRSVDSVLDQVDQDTEVIVVIDHCDELQTRVTDRYSGEHRVKVIPNAEQQGLSGARNTGVSAARGDVVAFLDDDAEADSEWAQRLIGHYQDPTVVGVGGYAVAVWPGARPAWMPREFDWVVGCSYTGQPTIVAPVRNPIGCNMSLRRSALESVGGFKSEVGRVGAVPVGGEETELCIRVRAAGDSAQILFDPDMRVHHHVSSDRATVRYFVRRCYHEGLSKAVVMALVGDDDQLSSERAYVTRVLPRALFREVGSMSRDGLARAAMICVGLGVTAAGYGRATVSRGLRRRRP
ncbi:glycosyltransferase family 2 protein [Mycolicibacterium brisbanense]|uniref:glycosyltransferase family 2 protein n=1 Tax=Mycolicibacterium brisbanense TaxID=146020 RepID=UPI001F239805|nr:glycosyltransferase [Mycolicibacterium brisbanense]